MAKYLPGDGYFVGQLSDKGALTIGGRCPLKGANSPNNGLPLTQFARVRLNPDEFFIPEWAVPEIHFLYSWKCKIHMGDFSYRYRNDEVEVVDFRQGREEEYDDFPYENYPVLFGEVQFGLMKVPAQDQEIILKLNGDSCSRDFKLDHDRLSVPTHQFGGVPYLLDVPEERRCTNCKGEMPIVASIGNRSYTNDQGFVDNDFVQVVYWACGKCLLVSARNFVD